MGKFKIDEWVYTYDEQGLVYKHQVRGNVGVFYDLTGKSEPVNTQYVFKTKKECLKAMKDAGIQKASLHMATVIKLENKIADLEAELAESDEYRELLLEEKAGYLELISGYADKCNQLKQQLAEKDAEIQSWKDGTMVVKLGKLEEQLAEKDEGIKDLLQEIEDMENSQNVTAIAELEKVKEWLELKYFDKEQINYLAKAIDQQIKELKGE